MVDANGNGSGLGVQKGPLTVVARGQRPIILVHYQNGDICPADNSRRYAATWVVMTTVYQLMIVRMRRVELHCSYGDIGRLILRETDDPCHHQFVWPHPAACPSGMDQGSGNCSVTDPRYGMTFDLSSLKSLRPYLMNSIGLFLLLIIQKFFTNFL